MLVGQAIHAGDLKLPSGVTLQVEPDILVLHVLGPQAEEEAEAAEGAEVPEPVGEAAEGSSEGEQAG
jgi:large subunit ribosomal protein L25